MTEIDWNSFIAALITIASIIIAWWKSTQLKEVSAKLEQSIPVSVVVSDNTVIDNDFVLPRDGRILYKGGDGWYARLNPSLQASTIPDDKAYQAVSPLGKFYSGNKDTIYYLVTSVEAQGWRERNK